MNSSGRIYADVGEYHIETNYTDRRIACMVTRSGNHPVVFSESESLAGADSNLAYKIALKMHDRARGFVEIHRKKVPDGLLFCWPDKMYALFTNTGVFVSLVRSDAVARHKINQGEASYYAPAAVIPRNE